MAYGKPDSLKVGDLRWAVCLSRRVDTPDGDVGITQTLVDTVKLNASITPIGLQTFLNGEQTDTPITHRIITRWLDNTEMFDVISREITRPDGSTRTDLFRIRRVTEWEGRQRYSVFDVEQEKRD